MPRALRPEQETEYAELNAFVRFYAVECKGLSEAAFNQASAEIELKFGRSKALAGLRQAVNDTVEELSHAKPEAISKLDEALAANGLVSFSELRRRYSSQYKRVLKRGAIRSETEFYLVSSLVSDLAANISAEERVQLQRMLEAYEKVT